MSEVTHISLDLSRVRIGLESLASIARDLGGIVLNMTQDECETMFADIISRDREYAISIFKNTFKTKVKLYGENIWIKCMNG